MTSKMSADLFSAILAMDVYNRGYGKKLDHDQQTSPVNLWIGNAQIKSDSRVLGVNSANASRDEAAGFYGVSYDTSLVHAFNSTKNGVTTNIDTAVSYRGTTTNASGLPDSNDIYNGWTIALGYGDAAQATLAKEFFVHATSATKPYMAASNTLLTGHSLGGALAGFVGAISGTSALVFDHMPFGTAAVADVANEARVRNSGTLPASLSDVSLNAPNMNVVKGIYVEGEALEGLRSGAWGNNIGDLAGTWGGAGQFLATFFRSLDDTAVGLESEVDKVELENYGAFDGVNPLNAVSLHSQALLVAYLYGRDVAAGSHWQLVAPLFLEKMFDEDIAESLGLVQGVTGTDTAGAQLSIAIAYSAIDEGTRIYGDTGIAALFDDGNDLGKFTVEIDADPSGVSEVVTSETVANIATLMATYAGGLALAKIEADLQPERLNGIVHYDATGGALTVDLRFDTWYSVLPTGSGGQPQNKEAFIQQLFDETSVDPYSIQAAYEWYGGEAEDGYELIDSVTFDTNGTTNEIPVPFEPDELGIIFTRQDVGGAHVITAGNYMIIGGDAADFIIGGTGMSMLFGGAGDDILVGGDSSDWFDGGSGTNVIWGGAINDEEDNSGSPVDTVYYGSVTASQTFSIVSDGTALRILTGSDTLYSIEEIEAGGGADHLIIDGKLPDGYQLQIKTNASGGTTQTVDLSNSTDTGGMQVTISPDHSYVGSNTATIGLTGYHERVSITGSDYDDSIVHVGSGYRTVIAGDGNDSILADEEIAGGTVASGYYSGGDGEDRIEAGAGNDILIGGAMQDDMWGGAGSDFIRAEADDGVPTTSGGWDYGVISGGSGHDAIVIGGSAVETAVRVAGESGNDHIVLGDNLFLDFIYQAGDGYDTIVQAGDGSHINSMSIFDISSDLCSVMFSLKDYEFENLSNDDTWESYSGLGDLSFIFEDDPNTAEINEAGCITIRGAKIEFSVDRNFTGFSTLQFSDLNQYSIWKTLDFYNNGSITSVSSSGVKSGGIWNTDGLDFGITLDDLDSSLTRAFDDFLDGRSGEPPISPALWIV